MASGETDTLFSPGNTSLGTPILYFLPMVKFFVSKDEKFYRRRPDCMFRYPNESLFDQSWCISFK